METISSNCGNLNHCLDWDETQVKNWLNEIAPEWSTDTIKITGWELFRMTNLKLYELGLKNLSIRTRILLKISDLEDNFKIDATTVDTWTINQFCYWMLKLDSRFGDYVDLFKNPRSFQKPQETESSEPSELKVSKALNIEKILQFTRTDLIELGIDKSPLRIILLKNLDNINNLRKNK